MSPVSGPHSIHSQRNSIRNRKIAIHQGLGHRRLGGTTWGGSLRLWWIPGIFSPPRKAWPFTLRIRGHGQALLEYSPPRPFHSSPVFTCVLYIFWQSSLETKMHIFFSHFPEIKFVKNRESKEVLSFEIQECSYLLMPEPRQDLAYCMEEVCVSTGPCPQACCVLMMTQSICLSLQPLRNTTFHPALLTPWGHALCLPLYIQSGWIPPTVLCPNPTWQKKQKSMKDPTVYMYIFYTVNSISHTNGRGPLE